MVFKKAIVAAAFSLILPCLAFAANPAPILDHVTTQADTSSGPISNMCVTASSGSTCRTNATRASDTINALDYGVVGNGTTDDAPAIRALFSNYGSGNTILFPSGKTYLLKSTVAPGPYPASDNVAVILSQKRDFHVIAYGASFIIDPSIAFSQAFFFDRDTHWTWDGGTITGSRTGLTSSNENVAFGLMNNQDFRISNARIASGYGGIGGAFVGDWNVDGKISNIIMDGVGIGFDTAFSKDLSIDTVRATGADTNGNSGSGQVGNKFFSNIYDVPLVSYNYSGYSFSDTDSVSVTNCDFSNFSTGIAVASGAHFRFSRNNSHDNPGITSAKGLGYYIYYNNGGVSTSVGHPVSDVVIDGGQILNNGSAVPGYGVLISTSTITNSDVVDGISIQNILFDNNTSAAIGADAATGIANFTIGVNLYKGTLQTTQINSNAQSQANSIQFVPGGGLSLYSNSNINDLGLRLSLPSVYAWQYNASTANGNFYLYDQLYGKFPFTINPNSLTSALTINANGVPFGGVAGLVVKTVAALPSCTFSLKGALEAVSDATSPAYNATLTGGGSNFALAACNGSAWTAH